MEKLTTLPNIGKVLATELNKAGIETISDLKKLGAEKAFIRLSALDETNCLHKLYALEGAVQGIRWHQLSAERKQELSEFFHCCKSKNAV